MATIYFMGYVEPLITRLSIENLPTLAWLDEASGITASYRITVLEAIVSVEIELERFDRAFTSHLFNRAFDLTRAAVDLVSFRKGWGLTVYLNRFIDPAGNEEILMPTASYLEKICTAYDLPDLDQMYRLVVMNPAIFMSLNELIAAITLPHHAPVNCARAIEGIRILISPNEHDKNRSWKNLQNALNIEKNFLDFMTKLSEGPRHGDRRHIPQQSLEETVRRSCKVMDRYLRLLQLGVTTLPADEFPTLS